MSIFIGPKECISKDYIQPTATKGMQAFPQTKATITLLIEGDNSDKNYTAYIPELRLGAVGDTIEEARENALDLAKMERNRLRKYLKGNSEPIIEKIDIDLDEE